MKVWIISIGTELTMGQTVDTNSAWLSRQLAGIGVHCERHVTLADEREPIRLEIERAARHSDIVLISGGLGPTEDDLTRQCLADAMGVALELHQPSMDQIAAFFATRNRKMAPANRVQAMIPTGASPIENTCGTAPGIRARLNNKDIYCMPGVPREMKEMFTRDVLPHLRAVGGGASFVERSIRTYGGAESEVGEKIADLMARGRNPTVGTSAEGMIITIRINSLGSTPDEAAQLAEADAAELRRRLGDIVFGEDDESLQSGTGRLLIATGKTVSTAESCTGGLIAKRLTDVSGASAYLMQAIVAYSNEAKSRLLGVPTELIERHGAVSAEVAAAMAVGCRQGSGADYALSATGVAGPTGGTAAKPIGLLYIGLASAERVQTRELRMGDHLTREEIRDRTAKAAINWLRLELLRVGQ